MFRTGAQMMILVLLAGLFFLRESHQDIGSQLDAQWATQLSLFSPGRSHSPPPLVALIAIDDSSLASHPWPWTPLDFSLFVQAALPFQPDVLAIEEILNWDRVQAGEAERQKLSQYERILRDVLLRTPKLILGARLGFPEDPQVLPPLQPTPLLRNVRGDLESIPEWTAIEDQASENYRLSATPGFTNLPESRIPGARVPLLLRYRGQVVPSFVLQAALLWYQLQPEDVSVELGSFIAIGKKVRIPIDARGQLQVNLGVPRNVFSFDDLLLAAEQTAAKTPPVIPPERLKSSILLLGRKDSGTHKRPVTPRVQLAPGELFASALATIQTQAFLHRVPPWFDGALIGVITLLSYWIPRLRKRHAALGALILLLVYASAAVATFSLRLIWLPIVLPTGLLLFATLYRLATPDWVGKPRRPVLL